MISIPINSGTSPDIDLQVKNARLRGAFVDSVGIRLLPVFSKKFDTPKIYGTHESTYNNRLFYVAEDSLFYVENNVIVRVSNIESPTINKVHIDENQQNQIVFATGRYFYVYDQKTSTFTVLDEISTGLKNPVMVIVFDTIAIIIGGTDLKWTYSQANNATEFGGNEIYDLDPNAGSLTGIAEMDNAIYIMSEEYTQRWVPSPERTPYDSPFIQDTSYRDEYGCISIGSLTYGNNMIIYQTNNNQIRMLYGGQKELISADENGVDGISTLISGYTSPTYSFGIYFYHKDKYFYQISFEENSFVYCISTKRWSESDDFFVDYSGSYFSKLNSINEKINDYTLSQNKIVLRTEYLNNLTKSQFQNIILSTVFLNVTQGKEVINSSNEQKCGLSISRDNVQFGNKIFRIAPNLANRLQQYRWNMGVSSIGFCLEFELYAKSDITIIGCLANIEV